MCTCYYVYNISISAIDYWISNMGTQTILASSFTSYEQVRILSVILRIYNYRNQAYGLKCNFKIQNTLL